MNTKNKLTIMQAYIDNKEIEYKSKTDTNWKKCSTLSEPVWDWYSFDYRISYTYPLWFQSTDSSLVVRFTGESSGIVVVADDVYKVGHTSNKWDVHYGNGWEQVDEPESSYPLFFKDTESELVVRFISIDMGNVVIGNKNFDVTHEITLWTEHTDSIWEQLPNPPTTTTIYEWMVSNSIGNIFILPTLWEDDDIFKDYCETNKLKVIRKLREFIIIEIME